MSISLQSHLEFVDHSEYVSYFFFLEKVFISLNVFSVSSYIEPPLALFITQVLL